jgi:uncharacterized membrane protein (GlpM family)
MSLREAIVRFVVGGALILCVSSLGRTKYAYVSGLAALFPIVTLVGYYFLSTHMDGKQMQHVVLYSFLAMPALLMYLLVVYFTIDRLHAWQSLSLGLLVWLLVASATVAVSRLGLELGGGARRSL